MTFSPRFRFELLKRDGFRCHYCGRRAPDVELHVDHIIPRSKGGSNSPDNLIAACAECNLGKSNQELVLVTPCILCSRDVAGAFFDIHDHRDGFTYKCLVCHGCLQYSAEVMYHNMIECAWPCHKCGVIVVDLEQLPKNPMEMGVNLMPIVYCHSCSHGLERELMRIGTPRDDL